MIKKILSFSLTLVLLFICSGCSTFNEIPEIPEAEPIITETIPPDIDEILPSEEPTIETEPPFKEFTFFDESTTFEYSLVESEDLMRYIQFVPTNADQYEKLPLLVWLHGTGEKNASAEKFFDTSFVEALCNWELEGVNAYILCPQLYGDYHSKFWSTEEATQNVKNLIDDFSANHNVDTSKIVIMGHSLGGQGCQYMAYSLPDYFSAQVVMSGYPAYVDMNEVTIPTIAYIGTSDLGETEGAMDYTYGYFKSVYGEESIVKIPASHGYLPKASLIRDKNENNRSDLMEWIYDNIY